LVHIFGQKKIFKIKNIFLFISIFSIACITQPSTKVCGQGNMNINEVCYNEIDIGIFQEIIDISLYPNISIDDHLDTNLLSKKWTENEPRRLTYLWLYDNSLSGNLPNNIGDLEYLDTLNLSYNNLSGNIPLSIGNLENLKWLYLKLNNFSGTIPDTVCAIYSNLKNVSFAYNKFCPPYPDCIPIEKIGAQDTTNCEIN